MSSEILVHLTLNGQPQTLAVDARTTLLSAIRHQLDLTGTKRGCALIMAAIL